MVDMPCFHCRYTYFLDSNTWILGKQVPWGTTMHPLAYFPTGIFQHIFWAGLKHFYWDFWSGFTMIYGEKYSFLSLFTKALRTNGRTNRPTDTTSYRDARTHLKTLIIDLIAAWARLYHHEPVHTSMSPYVPSWVHLYQCSLS